MSDNFTRPCRGECKKNTLRVSQAYDEDARVYERAWLRNMMSAPEKYDEDIGGKDWGVEKHYESVEGIRLRASGRE